MLGVQHEENVQSLGQGRMWPVIHVPVRVKHVQKVFSVGEPPFGLGQLLPSAEVVSRGRDGRRHAQNANDLHEQETGEKSSSVATLFNIPGSLRKRERERERCVWVGGERTCWSCTTLDL